MRHGTDMTIESNYVDSHGRIFFSMTHLDWAYPGHDEPPASMSQGV